MKMMKMMLLLVFQTHLQFKKNKQAIWEKDIELNQVKMMKF
jgi:hypothetical protein